MSLAANVLTSHSQGERPDAINCRPCNVTISQLQPMTTQLLASRNSFKFLCHRHTAHPLQSWWQLTTGVHTALGVATKSDRGEIQTHHCDAADCLTTSPLLLPTLSTVTPAHARKDAISRGLALSTYLATRYSVIASL